MLARSKMTFQQSTGVQETPSIANLQIELVKYTDKNFEVRYAIRLLDYLLNEYTAMQKKQKPGNILLNPNTLCQSLLQVTILNISGGQLPDSIEFDSIVVEKEYNTDSGDTAFVEVGKEFGQNYKYCVIVALYKDDLADAYLFFLSDTKEGFSERMDHAFHSLRFK